LIAEISQKKNLDHIKHLLTFQIFFYKRKKKIFAQFQMSKKALWSFDRILQNCIFVPKLTIFAAIG
jgi:hypothetical protein